MALVSSSSSSSAISGSLLSHSISTQDFTGPQIGSFRPLDRPLVPSTATTSSRRRCSVKPVFAEPKRNESTVPLAAASTVISSASEVVEKVEIDEDYEKLAKELENASPLEIMDRALGKFGNDIAIAFSTLNLELIFSYATVVQNIPSIIGAEDVALIEYARLTGRPFRVFSLDTGRLNAETYRYFDAVEKHYGIRIEYMFPDAVEVQALVRSKGLFSFYEDGHQECCRVRKVRPLRRALKGLRAWITGQRKDQSPGTRAEVPVVQVDPVFEGLDGGVGSLVKWNPVANMDGGAIWNLLRTMDVPVNELHSKGYVSIGCEPCTRPVLPWQHEREGRWWWEDAKAKECGLHKGNVKEENSAHVNGANRNGASTQNSADIFNAEHCEYNEGWRRELDEVREPKRTMDCCSLRALAMESSFVELAEKLEGSGVKVGKFRADGDQKTFAQQELQLGSFPTILFFPKNSSKPIKYPSEKRDADSLIAFINALR
ncbi:hypothetical protein Syun_026954 [Stephania yunnanensis]|uniref:Phosphoadenosine phosphosulphate reductase domain-containing protein n=1 Tax=Stephania yunnanensis TaxID=152371 RepID=A0AAP0EK71_9MAGN